MLRLTIDYESYYSADYSLSKMSPAEYILDPRFECIGASVRLDTAPPLPRPIPDYPEIEERAKLAWQPRARWVHARDLPTFFARVDWSKTALQSHNIGFDGAITAWHYGCVPALYIDTLGMARATIFAETGRASLKKTAEYLGLPDKGDEVVKAMGWRLADFERVPDVFAKYQSYACKDGDLSAAIFMLLGSYFAGDNGTGTIHRNEELLVMDAVARMTILPQFTIDSKVVANHLAKVKADKAKLIDKLTASGLIVDSAYDPRTGKRKYTDLQSNERFAEVLRTLGVEPPTKISLKTGQEAFAFAKTDPEFVALTEHEDELVQAAVAARLGFKSTQEETRAERFLRIGALTWPAIVRNCAPPAMLAALDQGLAPMPFPLKYGGAHTHRLSGDWLLNMQNLGRKSQLRAGIGVPEGYLAVGADASQIEARVVAWLAGALRVVNAFRNKEDIYASFASMVYGFAVNKLEHEIERFVGKTGVLGLGFGMAALKFILTVWRMPLADGQRVKIGLDLATRVVNAYRNQLAPEVPQLWNRCDQMHFAISQRQRFEVGPCYTDADQGVVLPNGQRLFYRNLRRELLPVPGQPGETRIQWVFDYGSQTKYTFGGKTTENIVQALARIITMHVAVRIRKDVRLMGAFPIPGVAGQIHDQLLYACPVPEAENLKELLVFEMSQSRDWYKDLPLAAEGAIGANLLEAK